MRERDEEGRPVATHNAGAFLSPVGVVPAPSSMLDESDGARSTAANRQLALTERTRWTMALATSVAAWVSFAWVFGLVLVASERFRDSEIDALNYRLLVWMHTDAFWIMANIVFLIIGVKLGSAFAPAQGWRRLAAMIIATAIGAAVITILVGLLGQAAAAFAAGAAILWLVVARWLQP